MIPQYYLILSVAYCASLILYLFSFYSEGGTLVLTNYISIILYVYIFALLYRKDRSEFIIHIYPIVYFSWVVLACLVIESGAYITEQFSYGQLTGATARLSFLTLSFLFGSVFTVKILLKIKYNRIYLYSPIYSKNSFSVGLSIIVIGVLSVYGLKFGFPFLDGVDRFSYWSESSSLAILVRKFTYVVPIIGFFIFLTEAYKLVSVKVLLSVLLLLLLLFSDKFSGPFDLILYSLLGFFINISYINKASLNIKKLFKYLFFPILILALIATLGFMYIQNINGEVLFDKIISRIFVLQGHTYYGADLHTLKGNFPIEFFEIFDKSSMHKNAGMTELMYLVSDYDFVTAMQNLGIRFSQGGIALVIYKASFTLAPFVMMLFGIVSGIFFYYVIRKAILNHYMRLFAALAAFNSAYVNAFLMGDYSYLYGNIALVFYIFVFVDMLLFLILSRRVKSTTQVLL
jgi:hypothetical protein